MHTQQTPAHQCRTTTLHEPQTANPQPGGCKRSSPVTALITRGGLARRIGSPIYACLRYNQLRNKQPDKEFPSCHALVNTTVTKRRSSWAASNILTRAREQQHRNQEICRNQPTNNVNPHHVPTTITNLWGLIPPTTSTY